MDRKESIKTLLLGTASLPFINSSKHFKPPVTKPPEPMRSCWEKWPDMQWTGPQ